MAVLLRVDFFDLTLLNDVFETAVLRKDLIVNSIILGGLQILDVC